MASEFEGERVSWGSFDVEGSDGRGSDSKGYIQLAQKSRKSFALGSSITYNGKTGLEATKRIPPESLLAIRHVGPEDLTDTDLASVPSILRWFVSPYGVHTPAALIHDRLIGLEPRIDGITDQDVDRYFRFMLQDLGVRFIRRWLMWTATASRTRLVGSLLFKASLVIWIVLAAAGSGLFVFGALTGNWLLMGLAFIAPVPFSALWGNQYGAGLMAAYFAVPWVLPPTIFAGLFYVVYRLAEYLVLKVFGSPASGSEPLDYRYF